VSLLEDIELELEQVLIAKLTNLCCVVVLMVMMICDENQREGKRVKGSGGSVAATTREGKCRNLVKKEHIVHAFNCLC